MKAVFVVVVVVVVVAVVEGAFYPYLDTTKLTALIQLHL